MLIALINLFCSIPASANIPESDFTNVQSLSDADRVVDALMSRTGGQGEILLYQTGDRLPDELQWIIKRLSQKRLQVTVVRVNEETLQAEWKALEKAPLSIRS